MFTYVSFWQCPYLTLTFFSLMMSIFSLWVKRSAWMWGSFLLISFILGQLSGIISIWTCIPILILLFAHGSLTIDLRERERTLIDSAAIAISIPLIFHIFPGFHIWLLGPTAANWFYYDLPLVGLFILAFRLPLIEARQEWKTFATIAVPVSIIGVAIITQLIACWGWITWTPKISVSLLPWILKQLFFVAIPMEAFFRGFLQEEITHWLKDKATSAVISILLTSAIYALTQMGSSFSFIGYSFLASILYGTLYQFTKMIESSIFCHFLFNLSLFVLY